MRISRRISEMLPRLMKFPNPRSKVVTLRKVVCHTWRILTALKANIITPPLNASVCILQRKENDDRGKSNARGESSRQNVVVLEQIPRQRNPSRKEFPRVRGIN